MNRRLILPLLAVGLLLGVPLQGALNAYLKLKGTRQGNIEGSVTQKGREGTLRVLEYSHEIVSPRDAASGLPTGKRQHKPIRIVVELDRATPLLYQALAGGETLSEFTLRFYRPDRTGVEMNHFTIMLTNASIASVKTMLPDTQDPANASRVETTELTLTYQKITWTWTDGGVTAEDDWVTAQ